MDLKSCSMSTIVPYERKQRLLLALTQDRIKVVYASGINPVSPVLRVTALPFGLAA